MSDGTSWLDDIFDIPKNSGNIVVEDEDVQDNAYTEIGKGVNSTSFDIKAASVKSSIASTTDDSDSFEYVDKVEEGDANARQSEPIVKQAPISVPPIIGVPSPEVVLESANRAEVIESESSDDESEVRDQSECAVASQENAVMEDEDGWVLTCHAAKFKIFYQHKANKVQRLKEIGLIPFDHYLSELKLATVPIWTQDDDIASIGAKIKKIQDWKDRVSNIMQEVDPQLAWWGMVVEHMQGLLAMAQYEKPKERQMGMHYVHLRDMEYYLARLKGLKSNCTTVLDNLQSAFLSLSRQIAIFMPQLEMNRYASPMASLPPSPSPSPGMMAEKPLVNSASKPSSEVLSEFDILDETSNVKGSSNKKNESIIKGPQKTSWSSFSKKR